jgi:hypothetical protein
MPPPQNYSNTFSMSDAGSFQQPCRASDCLDPSVSAACRQHVRSAIDSVTLARWLSLRSVPTVSEPRSLSYLGKVCLGGDSAGADTTSAATGDGEPSEADPRYCGGLSGRAGKPADVCYAWWIGAARLLLQGAAASAESCGALSGGSWPEPWSSPCELAAFLLRCQNPAGGCGKDWESLPDPPHSCYSTVGLQLCGISATASGTGEAPSGGEETWSTSTPDLLRNRVVASVGVSCGAATHAAAEAALLRGRHVGQTGGAAEASSRDSSPRVQDALHPD